MKLCNKRKLTKPYGLYYNAFIKTKPLGFICEKICIIKPYGLVFALRWITDSEGLGNIIRNRRKELKYTQAFLSEYTGLSVSFISDVERGKTTVEIGKVMQLISILGLDININVRGR